MAIHHARCTSRRKSITDVRPSVWLPGHCFTPPVGRLFSPRRSVFICARDGHFADGSRRTRHIIALQQRRRSGGQACDELRQIADGTRWINLLSISADTSPRRSRSRIVASARLQRHHHSSSTREHRLLIRNVAPNCSTAPMSATTARPGALSSCGEIKTPERLMDYCRPAACPPRVIALQQN